MEIEKLIERLRQERASLELAFPGVNAIVFDVAADALTTMQDREATLIRERDALREALDPFARVARINDAAGLNSPDDRPCRDFFPGIWPTLGDCRKANEALGTSGLVERS